jgi:hypothetical protein
MICERSMAEEKTTFDVDIPDLGVTKRSIKFPRQIIRPPYKKEKPTSVSLAAEIHDELMIRRHYTSTQ